MMPLNQFLPYQGTALLYGPAQSYQATLAREIFCRHALDGNNVLALCQSQSDAAALLENTNKWLKARELPPRKLVTPIIDPRGAPESYLEAVGAKLGKRKDPILLVRDTSCDLTSRGDDTAWFQIAKEISAKLGISVLSVVATIDTGITSQTWADVILRCHAGQNLTVRFMPEKPRGRPIKLVGKQYPNGALLFEQVNEPIPVPPLVPIMPSNDELVT